MLERFTDRARVVVGIARREAERLDHSYLGTEHVLLGLAESTGVAVSVLENLEFELEKVRHEVEKRVKQGPNAVALGHLPFTPRAKRVLELACEEAHSMEHDWVGTEHLLLGLLRAEGKAAQILFDLGLKYDDVKGKVAEIAGTELSSEERGNQ